MTTLSLKTNFAGLGVVAFESRLAEAMLQGLLKHGAKALVAPSMQEIPLENNPEVLAFDKKLVCGKIDILICMTGIGTRMLIELLSKPYGKEKALTSLRKITIVARGPKPVKVLREFQVPIAVSVPEPNTWREILEELEFDKNSIELEGKTVAIQEYGIASEALVDALKKRGAHVIQVPVYRWALPEDTGPLEKAIEEIMAGQMQVALFTNAQQMRNLLRLAAEKGKEKKLREALAKMVIASVGPTATEAIQTCGFSVDFEPSHPKMGHLIAETGAQAHTLLEAKLRPRKSSIVLTRREIPQSEKDLRKNSLFMKACRREKTPQTPVWLMRQAGRYMKEYRELRQKVSFIELCKNPELAAEVTIVAQEKIKADAAIIFSDLLLIVEPMGLDLQYETSEGPAISGSVNVQALREVNPEESLGFVLEAIKLTRSSLKAEIPLIGFAGAPFTLASYILEGGGSKLFAKTKSLMYSDQKNWHLMLKKICDSLIRFLNAQIDAGADAVQIFDSWVGCLGPKDYEEFVLPHTKRVIENIKKETPVIHFGTGTGPFLKSIRAAGGDVIGVDYRVELDEAWSQIGYDKGIQGNLDPMVLCGPQEMIRERAKRILDQAAGRSGHIFNLGHGVLPNTPVENVTELIEFVREESRKKRS